MTDSEHNDDERGPDGRFRPGNRGGPGNPHVRRVAELQAAVRDAVEPQVLHGVMRKLARRALEGDVRAAKVLLERVCGKPRAEQPIHQFDLPAIEKVSDLPRAFERVAQAAATGSIAIDDAARFASVLELARRAIETSELATRVAELEAHLEGQVRRLA